MALQTRNLVMVGLGIEDDEPPNHIQPRLINGIHLRWAFERELGFPWYGYNLFRRPHRSGNPICLSSAITSLKVGQWHTNILSTFNGVISSEKNLFFTDDFTPPGGVEFNISDSRLFYFIVPTHHVPARRVELKVGFRKPARIEITALFETHPVIHRWIRGRAGETVTVTLEYDVISSVHIDSGPIALIDVCYVPVSQDAHLDWDIVEDFPYPLRLPITHTDYPCTKNQNEDLAAARQFARNRVHYDNPNRFTAIPVQPLYSAGTITVNKDSPIVTGVNTKWNDTVLGNVLQVSGDHTAYVIVKVTNETRLVLSRDYGGASQVGATYTIQEDAFAQLHDQLAILVNGGPLQPSVSMADRYLPNVIYSTGSVTVKGGDKKVTGINTKWTQELTGLGLQVIGDSSGAVSVKNNYEYVAGASTNWDADMVSMTFQITGEATEYTIVAVNTAQQVIKLDRGYEGQNDSGRKYTATQKAVYTITKISSSIHLELRRPFIGPKKAKKNSYQIVATLQSDISDSSSPRMSKQYPLDTVLLGTLHPALAQITGLYWADQRADQGVAYDYLIMTGRADLLANSKNPQDLLYIIQSWFEDKCADLDGYIVFNKKVEKTASLPPPKKLQAYALPGTYIPQPNGPSIDAQNNAGLKWNLGTKDGVLLPGQAVMYHIWRTEKSDAEPAVLPAANQYHLLTYNKELKQEKPVLVPRLPKDQNPHPPIWPPFRMHTIDRALEDGWYSYSTNGIDIFGRHSPNSDPAQWYQWAPETDPTPWYYMQPAGNTLIHGFAIRLLDKIPPPPPTGIEAHALDPNDPMVLKDKGYKTWRTQHPNEVGVRISWLWTPGHERQAPDIREFRIYFQSGRINALLGNTKSVKSVTETESTVEIDISNSQAAGKYTGAILQIDSTSFKVVDSEVGSPLKLRVRSGPVYKTGTVQVQDGSVMVTGTKTTWKKNLIGCNLTVADETISYTILDVDHSASPQQLKLDRPYHGKYGDTNTPQNYVIAGKSPVAKKSCTVVIPPPFRTGTIKFAKGSEDTVIGTETGWTKELIGRTLQVVGEAPKYSITKVDSTEKLKISTKYQGRTGEDKTYIITHPLFSDYGQSINWAQRLHAVGYDKNVTEVIRPVQSADGKYLTGEDATVAGKVVQFDTTPGKAPDLSNIPVKEETLFPAFLWLEEDVKRPSKIYRITGVNTKNKTVTVDGQPDTGGNDSSWTIGLPVRKYEIFLSLPTAKFSPTLADPIVYAQIGVSAVDDQKHTQDHAKWGDNVNRYGNEGPVGAPCKINRVLREKPKAPIVPPDSDKVFAIPADYHGHSYYTYRWEPNKYLKTHIFRALDNALIKIDWAKRSENKMLVLDANNPKHLKFFPPDWQSNKHQLVAADLKKFVLTGSAATVVGDVVTLDGLPDLTKVKTSHDFIWLQDDTASKSKCYPIITVDTQAHKVKIDGQPKLGSNNLNWAIPQYNGLSNDALRVLAGLPGNKQAFTQITVYPLDPDDPNYTNDRGPSDPDDFQVWDAKKPPAQPKYPLADPKYRIYTDTLDGCSTNRYFYRSQYIDSVHNRSDELSISSPPIYLPNLIPASKPQLVKVLGGERQVTLKWAAHRESNVRRYLIYRTDNKQRGRDLRLMGVPVADLPAQPLIVHGGEVDLGSDTDIVNAERVYAAEGFKPDANLLNGQSTKQYLAAPIKVVNSRVTGFAAPDGTAVVVVYKDSSNRLQYSPWKTAPRVWVDSKLVGPLTYYYRVVAVSKGETALGKVEVYSDSSDLIAGRVYDLTPPDPPTWIRAEWVLLDSSGTEQTSGNPVAPDQKYSQAVALEWTSKHPYTRWVVQRALHGSELWWTLSPWITAEDGKGNYIDGSSLEDMNYVYRIRGEDIGGKTNSTYSEKNVFSP